jgi:iron complex transport system ATP-binding protein
MARLETRDLSLRIGQRLLVRELSVTFEAGQNWAILGANGSGKTTLLHTLAGLRRTDGGAVLLNGQTIDNVPRRVRTQTLGMLFQDAPNTFPATVFETVLGGRHPHLGFWQSESAADHALAHAALAAVGLADFGGRSVATLSGGERRRVEVATLLAQDAPLCLLDEPVNHLDPRHQIALLRLVCARAQHSGHLNLLVLHDVNLALRFCSHGLLLLTDGSTRHGRLDDILDSTVLEKLYGCAMREIRSAAERFFFPDEPP